MNIATLRLATAIVFFIAIQDAFAQTSCNATDWTTYKSVKLKKTPSGDAYFYATKHMAIDADGAPNAYHPANRGIDANANAGYPNGGWRNVLVEDPHRPGKPYVQKTGPFAGFFVAKTTLADPSLPVTDPNRYVDSTSVPYIVFPGAFHSMRGTGTWGDLGMVKNLDNGKETAFIVADAGPTNAALGEVSIKLAENLGGSHVNPRIGSGMPTGRFVYVVFPKSHSTPPWRIDPVDLDRKARDLLTDIGGWNAVEACNP